MVSGNGGLPMTDAIQTPQLTDEALLDALLALRQQVAATSAAPSSGTARRPSRRWNNLASYLESKVLETIGDPRH